MAKNAEMEWMLAVLLTTIFLSANSAYADVGALLSEVNAANNARVCQELYGDLGIGDKRIRTEIINPEMKNQKFMLREQPGYRPDAIYIGIANHEKDGTHHYYLNVGKTQFTALPHFGKAVASNGKLATNGLLFEIPVPPEIAAALEVKARTGLLNRNVSCLHALCSLLEKEGVVIQERAGKKSVRARVVLANLIEGKIKILGKDADPETMRLLATGGDELKHALYASLKADKNMAGAVKEKALIYVVAPAVGVPTVIGIFTGALYVEHSGRDSQAEKYKYRPLGTDD